MAKDTDSGILNAYFLKLAAYGGALLDSLPIELEPQPLEYALGKLAPALDARRAGETERLRQMARPEPAREPGSSIATGLNTIGMLTDRFTILLIKEWCLRHKAGKNSAKADQLFQVQTLDIIAALAAARPGSSSLNSKITSIKTGVSAMDWEEAFWGLFSTNLIIWESQEMLYIKDIGQAPCEELRAYISWFSRGNIQRNAYIEFCENFFWQHQGGRS
jgi:hypothetical protein